MASHWTFGLGFKYYIAIKYNIWLFLDLACISITPQTSMTMPAKTKTRVEKKQD